MILCLMRPDCFDSGANITPFVPSMLDRMIPIMQSMKVSAHLLENTAVTIGRLALASPESVASRLDDLLPIWGQAMMHANAGSEQDSALRGMCIAVSKNPSVIAQHGRWLLEALKVCTDPSSELRELSAPVGCGVISASDTQLSVWVSFYRSLQHFSSKAVTYTSCHCIINRISESNGITRDIARMSRYSIVEHSTSPDLQSLSLPG